MTVPAMNNKKDVRIEATVIGWVICILGAVFYCYEYLLRIEPSVMVLPLEHYFHISAAGLGILSGLYYMAYTPMQLVVGVVTDMFGPRRVLTLAVLICASGSFVFGTAHSVLVAGIGRFMIGFGSAFAFVGILKLASLWLPRRFFSLFTGLAVGLGMVGAMAGDIELTHLIHHIGWRQTVFVGTIFGVVLAPIIWLIVRDRAHQNIEDDEMPETSGFKNTMRGVFQIMKTPQMWLGGLIGCVLYFSLSVFAELWGIEFIKNVYHFTRDEAASINAMVFVGWLIGAPCSGWISEKIRSRRMPYIVGSLLSTIIACFVVYSPELSANMLRVLLFAFGFVSSVQILSFVIGRENSPHSLAASAVAFVNLIIMMSGLLFQPIVGKILEHLWNGVVQNGVHIYTIMDYRIALSVLPVGSFLGFILALMVRECFGNVVPDVK